MTTIAEAAATALEQQRLADEAFRQQYRDAIVADARTVLSAMVGNAVDVARLSVEHVNIDAEMVVLADPSGSLAVYTDGRVRLVRLIDGQWTVKPKPEIRTLAELGAALEAVA